MASIVAGQTGVMFFCARLMVCRKLLFLLTSPVRLTPIQYFEHFDAFLTPIFFRALSALPLPSADLVSITMKLCPI
jgi:hypothetical protein